MSNRFVYQIIQYGGDILPCTLEDFNRIVDSRDVAWRITTRQQVENAVEKGLPLDSFVADTKFQRFCSKHSSEASFQKLNTAQKLLQWTNSLKMGLPCFIFAASAFDPVPVTDKDGNPVLNVDGTPVMKPQRRLEGIHLSGIFMFDGDHLPMNPFEIFQRTQVTGFPWRVLLAHKTSSGHGLRLVCEARPEVGNIADCQIELARELKLLDVIGTTGKPVVDDSCIDASRISYAPRREDIYFIDEERLFNLKNSSKNGELRNDSK